MDLIVTHIGGDFDSLASLVAAKKIYPQARLLFPGSQEKNVREFISLCKNLVRIETEKDIKLDEVKRLIIVDTRLKSRIGKAAELLNRDDVEIHIYDHHPKTPSDIKADFEMVKMTGATVTILLDLIKKRNIEITAWEATIMALGIYEDTGSLTFKTTTKEDVDAVSFLMSKGADIAVVSSYLSRELSSAEIAVLVRLLQATESYLINGIKVAVSTIEAARYVGDLSVLAHKLIEIENSNVFFIIAQIENKVHIVARSRLEAVNVDRIMRKFGGGGHSTAASAAIKKSSFIEVKEKLLEILGKEIKPPVKAKDIMNSPVKTVTSDQIIDEARETMVRYRIGGMPVLTGGRLVGIITRSDVDKAIYHHFGHSRVKGYMSTNLITASPATPVYELQRIIFEENIGRVPIVLRGKLVGIVSRADLLRTVHEELMAVIKKTEKEKNKLPEILFEEDIAVMLKKQLPPAIFKILKIIGDEAYKSKIRVYLVGGFVRDFLLKVKNYDIDIVVEGEGIKFAGMLSKVLGGSVVAHKRFKTAILFTPLEKATDKVDGNYSEANGGIKPSSAHTERVRSALTGFTRCPGSKKMLRIDIATARTEYYEFPAALPKVELATLKKDLYRRDFTINAMAVSVNKNDFGALIDFFGGRKDILARRIKALHNLSFVEDPTRIFRAVRFEQRYDFKIDKHTEHLIKTAVSMDMIEKVAGERLREEVVDILSEEEPLKGIKRMAQLHELRFIHPKVKWSVSLERKLKKARREIEWFWRNTKENIDNWLVYFMEMLAGLTYEETILVGKKFMLSNAHKMKILSFIKDAGSIVKGLRQKKLSPAKIYELLYGRSFEEMILFVSKSNSGLVRKRVEDFIKIYSKAKLCLDGKYIAKMGVEPSPEMGKILKTLFDAKLNGILKSRKDEVAFCARLIKEIK